MARLYQTVTPEKKTEIQTQNNVRRNENAKPPKIAQAEPAMLEASLILSSPIDGLAANPAGVPAAVIFKIYFNRY